MGFLDMVSRREEKADPFVDLLLAGVPRDRNGNAVFLDSVVYHIDDTGARLCLVVAVSNKKKLCLRPIERGDGHGGRWVDAKSCVVAMRY